MNLKSNFFDKQRSMRIIHDELHADDQLATELISQMPVMASRPIVVVCIGTDRSTGDSLGPLVGTLLEEKPAESFNVYGTLDDPIHAVNLDEKLREIKAKHFHPFIIGIDACLGRFKSVGSIQIGSGPVKPGAGVNKELPEVGDMHITGIVNVSGFMEFFVLQNTRLSLVMKMAKTIASGLYLAGNHYPRKVIYPEHEWNQNQEQTN
jgi:putative sporulation protein YyaC